MDNNKIEITYAGIDFWNRPGYKVKGMEVYLGSVDVLFPNKAIAPNNTKEEIDEYFRNNLDKLVIFGSTFDEDHDPLGYRVHKDIEIVII